MNTFRNRRTLLILSIVLAGFGLSACAAQQQKPSSSLAVPKSAKATVPRIAPVRNAKASTAAGKPMDESTTASSDDLRKLIAGKTWAYDYEGARGTVTYHRDGTFSYDAANVMGSGKWQIRGDRFCQTVSQDRERCVPFRRSGSDYYIGHIKLTRAAPEMAATALDGR